MVEIKIKLHDLDYVGIIKAAFPMIRQRIAGETAAWATIIKSMNAPDENAIEAILKLIPETDRDALVDIALEAYKNAIPAALVVLARSEGITIRTDNVEVTSLSPLPQTAVITGAATASNQVASSSNQVASASNKVAPVINQAVVNEPTVTINAKEPMQEAYFNCLVDHLYGDEWDGVWDCDFEIDTDEDEDIVKFCTKYWLFSEFLELSWDQFIDGKFHLYGGKLYYEDQSLTMDTVMLPLIEAAQADLKQIRKQYKMLG